MLEPYQEKKTAQNNWITLMTEKGGFSFLEPPVSAKLNTTQPQTNETWSLKCSNLYLLWNILMGSLRLSHLSKMIWKIIPVVKETVKFFFFLITKL